MMGPAQALLNGGKHLHLQHGPIDLIIGADGDKERAFAAASARFETILEELVSELEGLKHPLTPRTPCPHGDTAKRMHMAALPFADVFLTPMAAVAGSVADTILHAMTDSADLSRAFVNNGGDIALHLTEGHSVSAAISDHEGHALGQVTVDHTDPIRGIATSGRHGRSHSLGIADSVTVLAATAAQADVAATLIANAVDLPNHPAITRVPAGTFDDASDLQDQLIVTKVGALFQTETDRALQNGLARAETYLARNLIHGASLHLNGAVRTLGSQMHLAPKGEFEHA